MDQPSVYNSAIKFSGGRSDTAMNDAMQLLAATNMVNTMTSYQMNGNNTIQNQSINYSGQPMLPVQTSPYFDEIKAVITEETSSQNQSNLAAFYEENGWNQYTEDTIREELNRNLTILNNVTSGVNYTESMFTKQHYNGFVPFYITNVAESLQYVDINFQNLKFKTVKIPEHPFQSTTDYAQPVVPDRSVGSSVENLRSMIPVVSVPKGNTKNCLMVNVKIYDIVNTTKYPVAIVLGQREKDVKTGGNYFKPWGKRNFAIDQTHVPSGTNITLSDSRVHWVIPPNYTKCNDHLTIYKSGYEVNLPIGARYPAVDGTKEKLFSSSEITSNNGIAVKHTVVASHPIVEWLFANQAYYPNKLNLPVLASVNGEVRKYDIPAKTYDLACDLFLRDFNLAVPIVNLSQMEICAFLLCNEKESYSQELNIQSDLEKMIKNLQFGKDTVIGQKLKETNVNGSVYFRMSTDHIFRDEWISPSDELQKT